MTLPEPAARILAKLSTMPGRKALVAGNDDFLPTQERPKTYGFDTTAPTMVYNAGPTLLLTHEPLAAMPPRCENIHGHGHGPGPEISPNQVNVYVKRTGYEPVRLSDLVGRIRRDQHC